MMVPPDELISDTFSWRVSGEQQQPCSRFGPGWVLAGARVYTLLVPGVDSHTVDVHTSAQPLV